MNLSSATFADDLGAALQAGIEKDRAAVSALPKSPLVDSEAPRITGLLNDAEALVKANRLDLALETLASASPGVRAVARAATNWDDAGQGKGKDIAALTKEWEEVGRRFAIDRPKFPKGKPATQTAYVRATAELSAGQIDEHYAVAVSYGRESGLSAGAYYLGRAEGQLDFALFVSRLTSKTAKPARIAPMASHIASLDDAIVSAYAKPGSTTQHSNFIIANSALKLARELDLKGLSYGAFLALLRSSFALALATTPAPPADASKGIAERLDALEKSLKASPVDETIGLAFVEKARVALEKSAAGGEGADRERLRALAIADSVLPRYTQLMEGFSK